MGFIWGLVRPMLPPKTADKIQLQVGPSAGDSPCPVKLGRLVSLEALCEGDKPRHAKLMSPLGVVSNGVIGFIPDPIWQGSVFLHHFAHFLAKDLIDPITLYYYFYIIPM